jgi:hypothetical protein
MGGGENATFLF